MSALPKDERRKRTARDDFQNDSFGSESSDDLDVHEGEHAADRILVASTRSPLRRPLSSRSPNPAPISADTSTISDNLRNISPPPSRKTDDMLSSGEMPGGLQYNTSMFMGNTSSNFVAKIGAEGPGRGYGTAATPVKAPEAATHISTNSPSPGGKRMPPAVAAAMAAINGGTATGPHQHQSHSQGFLTVPQRTTDDGEGAGFMPIVPSAGHPFDGHEGRTHGKVAGAPATAAAAAAYANMTNRSDVSRASSSSSRSMSSRGTSNKASLYMVPSTSETNPPPPIKNIKTKTKPTSTGAYADIDDSDMMLLDGGRVLMAEAEDRKGASMRVGSGYAAGDIEMGSMSVSSKAVSINGPIKVRKGAADEAPMGHSPLSAELVMATSDKAGEQYQEGSPQALLHSLVQSGAIGKGGVETTTGSATGSGDRASDSRTPLVAKVVQEIASRKAAAAGAAISGVESLNSSVKGSAKSGKGRKSEKETGSVTALFSIDEDALVASLRSKNHNKIQAIRGVDNEAASADGKGTHPQVISHEELKLIFLEITERALAPRSRVHHILYNSAIIASDIFLAKIYDILHIFFVLFSVCQFVIMTMPSNYNPSVEIGTPSFVLECITSAFFTIDFLLRVVTMPTARKLLTPSLLVDFLSFVGFYIELIYFFSTPDDTSSGALVFLRILRILRIFRIFKILRSNRGFRLLVEVVIVSKESLVLLAILVLVAIMVFSSVLYSLEQLTSNFDNTNNRWLWADGEVSCYQSIPETFLFICTTMCTVGYGDCIPHNWFGKAWSALVMFSGMLVLAFPNILIGSNFAVVHKKMKKQEAQQALGKYFRKVRMVVRFIRMWREFRVRGHISMLGGPSPAAAAAATNLNPNANLDGGGMRINARGRRMNNFIFRVADYPDRYLSDWSTKAASGAVDKIRLGPLTLLSFMQRLLECFSGCASIDELTSIYQLIPATADDGPAVGAAPAPLKKFQSLSAMPTGVSKSGVMDPQADVNSNDGASELTQASMFEMALRGGAAQLLSIFISDRDTEKAIVCLTRRGIAVLGNFSENDDLPCLRGYEEAREIWHTTVRHNFFDFLPTMEGYPNWQTVQARTQKRNEADFLYDHRLITPETTESNYQQVFSGFLRRQRGSVGSLGGEVAMRIGQHCAAHRRQCQCRFCNSKWGLSAPVRPVADYCFNPDEELLTLELEYAQQAILICKLERQLATLQR